MSARRRGEEVRESGREGGKRGRWVEGKMNGMVRRRGGGWEVAACFLFAFHGKCW